MKLDILKDMNIQIPFSEEYVTLLGCAVYCFDYYEACIVDILSILDPNFRNRYYRELSLTSGQLKKAFEQIKNELIQTSNEVDQCFLDFSKIIEERNRLIHAHPITDKSEGQILYYQVDVKKTVHDYRWGKEDIVDFIKKVNNATIKSSSLLYSLRKKPLININDT